MKFIHKSEIEFSVRSSILITLSKNEFVFLSTAIFQNKLQVSYASTTHARSGMHQAFRKYCMPLNNKASSNQEKKQFKTGNRSRQEFLSSTKPGAAILYTHLIILSV